MRPGAERLDELASNAPVDMVRLASGRKLSTSSQPYAGPRVQPSFPRLAHTPPSTPLVIERRSRPHSPLLAHPPLGNSVASNVETFGTRRIEERYASFGYPTGRLARLRSSVGVPLRCILDRIGPGDRYAKGSSSQDFQHNSASMPIRIHESAFRYMSACRRMPDALVCFVTGERYVAW